jgi:hypothetical protein
MKYADMVINNPSMFAVVNVANGCIYAVFDDMIDAERHADMLTTKWRHRFAVATCVDMIA